MTKFLTSRRQIVGAAGATFALAACGKASVNPKDAVTRSAVGTNDSCLSRKASPFGTWPNCGDLPTVSGTVSFNPRFVTLVWIEGGADWDISTTHASFEVVGTVDLDAFAIDAFSKMHGGGRKPKFKNIRPRLPLVQYQDRDTADFESFGFASQHAIYFYFSSNKVEVLEQFDLDANGDPLPTKHKHFFAFSPFRANGEIAQPNDTFYDGAEIPHRGTLRGPLLRLNNYYNFKPEQQDPQKKLVYSLNIYFQIKNGNQNPIVMMLDPDTGNGYGYNP